MRFEEVTWERPEERALFVEEARELLDALETEALAERPAVDTLFRAAHTLKGSGGMVGLDQWVAQAHALEEVLDAVRRGERSYDEAVRTAVLETVDRLRAELQGSRNPAAPAQRRRWVLVLDPACPMPGVRAYQAFQAVSAVAPEAELEVAPEALAEWDHRPVGLWLPATVDPARVRAALATVDDVVRVEGPEGEATTEAGEAAAPTGRENTVRIGVETIERLLETIGELLLDEAQLEHQLAGKVDAATRNLLSHLRRKALEVQETTLRARMLPLDRLFRQYPRAVHDLALKLGKTIRLETVGGETELDRLVMDSLHEPLLHLLRNACDHGIESPGERQALGKSPTGVIRLEAYAAEGHVHLRIRDDGRGINWQAVREKAVERGWLRPEDATQATPADLQEFLFRPGLSTAAQVTDLSGRGVGLDAVRAFLDQVHGTVTVESTPGQGTTFHLELPMTMAILTALLVEAGPFTVGLPIGVVERIEERRAAAVSTVLGQSAVAEGDEPVACYELAALLDPEAPGGSSGAYLVRVRDGRTRAALAVDQVLGQQEVVVKPIAALTTLTPWMTGVALLGDGRLSFMLDVRRLVPQTGVERREVADDHVLRAGSNQMELLVFRLADGQRYGINVYKTREVVVAPPITRVPGQHPWLAGFARLRGQTVPVVDLAQALGVPGGTSDLMIITEFNQTVQAFPVPEVERMLRVSWEAVEPLPAILGTRDPARRRLTGLIDHPQWGPIQLIDFEQILAEVMPPAFPPLPEATGAGRGRRVWLADDSLVAVRQVEKALEPLGLEVRTFSDGMAVWEAVEAGEPLPHLFVLDVEMPRLDGYTLTHRLKRDPRTAALPVLLHTSLSGHWHAQRSATVEADAIVTKFDPALLARTVAGLLLPDSHLSSKEEVPA
ncbi:MAG: chemotaxis protein CheW [Firmicutes bacterium]|nr:chemotaxis protein CheW [Alicyclobacillaceae bacterium]MCL6496312.1 chemotaxis protein CheW [Bacillota bacterium]